MNAYELADDINDVVYVLTGAKVLAKNTVEEKLIRQAANMLRQQADRIAELEKETSDLKVQLTDALSYKLLVQTAKKKDDDDWKRTREYCS